MKTSLTQYTVIDLCKALERGDLLVNRDYQRTARVWPEAARSFLIETILLDYPIPKIYLTQITDVKTKETRREIVDGQQRTMAIVEFYNDKYKLRRNAIPQEAAGKSFETMPDDLRGRFLSYTLSADLFIGANSEDVREMFRRMNSYTVPLNAEEKRHSEFQGEFKWFIYEQSKAYAQTLEEIGVFKEKQLARMADAKLLAEICHAFLLGITTTTASSLRKLYAAKDAAFPEQETVEHRLQAAINVLIELKDLHGTVLMKPYQVYALLLALMHAANTVPTLAAVYQFKSATRPALSTVLHNLSLLAEALDDPDAVAAELAPFVEASEEKTNVTETRTTRFRWFCMAIEDSMQG